MSDVLGPAGEPAGPGEGGSSGTSDVLLSLRALEAGYDGVVVVRGIDLDVSAGEVVALLGGNGAGKTTTLLTVSGLLPILGGSIQLFGSPLRKRRRIHPDDVSARARSGVAHVPENRGLFFDLTPREHLRLAAPRRATASATTDVLELFPPLRDVLDRCAGLLSGGQQQMLALASALVREPKLLIVDELSLGLAPVIVEELVPVLRRIADERGTGVLVVEQHVSLLLSVADSAYVMTRGQITASGPARELMANRHLIEAGYLGEAHPTSSSEE